MNQTSLRDDKGRFALGNPGGPGNPYVQRTTALRSVLLDAVSEDDVRDVVAMLIAKAKAGDIAAAREVLDRVIGKATLALGLAVATPPDGKLQIPVAFVDDWYGTKSKEFPGLQMEDRSLPKPRRRWR